MKTRWLALAGATLGAGLLIGAVYWYIARDDTIVVTQRDVDQARLKLQGGGAALPASVPTKPLDKSTRVRLAIGRLGTADQAQQTADLLAAELAGAKGLDLVERASLDKVLRELELSAAGVVRAQDAVRVGKLVQADWFLLGTLTALTNGPSAIVARVVDARTGIMRDASVIEAGGSPISLAARVAKFVRDCREGASVGREHVYLAVGSFEDLSVNNRTGDFVEHLHSFLIETYRGSRVTLLERQFVNTLLNEVRLDLAGLTEQSGQEERPRMQSAFWLIDGLYQSSQSSGSEMELELYLRRILGSNSRLSLNAPTEQLLLRKIKEAVDEAMAKSGPLIAPSRNSELRVQLEAGRQLSQFDPWMLSWAAPPYENLDAAQSARRRRNLEEAIRAFETVLLFEPTNREAKMYLGTLLRRYPVLRTEEGLDYYRQLIEEPLDDIWSGRARAAFERAAAFEPAAERARRYRAAIGRSQNPAAVVFYTTNAEAAETTVAIRSLNPQSKEVAERRLFSDVDQWATQMRSQAKSSVSLVPILDSFAEGFGTNRAAAAERFAELMPRLKGSYPDLEGYLYAGAVSLQVGTNSGLIAEFERSFDRCVANPEKLVRPKEYFSSLKWLVLRWGATRKQYSLTVKVITGTRSAAEKGFAEKLDEEQVMSLAFAYLGLERWREALAIFESYQNRPVYMGNLGLWGRAFTVVLTSKHIAECREKLGLPPLTDPHEFPIGKPILCLHEPKPAGTRLRNPDALPPVLVSDATCVWVADGKVLLCLDFDLQTNYSITLPVDPWEGITCLCPSETNLWIGTAGSGLFSLDRSNRKSRKLTEADGLFLNHIGALSLCGDQLWIGYALKSSGGLGRLDLRSGKPISYAQSLTNLPSGSSVRLPGREDVTQPTRSSVCNLIALPSGDVWFTANAFIPASVRRYSVRRNVWEFFGDCQCVAANDRFLFVGDKEYYSGGEPGTALLRFTSLEKPEWRTVPAPSNLPPANVTALACSGNDIWMGGMGYIARYDCAQAKLRAWCYVSAEEINRLQVGGGYLWAQFDAHLYRVRISDVP